jgi:hypothetical protein
MEEHGIHYEQHVKERRLIMNLIDTYVAEVGRRLPRKYRMDIEAEIHSVLEDLLDDLSKESHRPVDDEMILDVLKEYGDPEKVAASYQDDRYLIGPRLYPIFLTVIKVIFPAIAILAGLGALIQVSRQVASVNDISGLFVSVLVGVVATSVSALGNIVLIFAIIEWVMRNERMTIKGKTIPARKEWDPRSLTKISSPNQVKLSQMILEIVACFAAIVIFNIYPQFFRFGFISDNQWYIGTGSGSFFPLLSDTFFSYLPYLTAVWVLTILLDFMLLRMGHWNLKAGIISVGLKVISILIVVALLIGPSLLGITTASLAAAGFPYPPDTASTMIFSLNQLVRLVLGLTIFLSGLDIVKSTIRIIRQSQSSKVPAK